MLCGYWPILFPQLILTVAWTLGNTFHQQYTAIWSRLPCLPAQGMPPLSSIKGPSDVWYYWRTGSIRAVRYDNARRGGGKMSEQLAQHTAAAGKESHHQARISSPGVRWVNIPRQGGFQWRKKKPSEGNKRTCELLLYFMIQGIHYRLAHTEKRSPRHFNSSHWLAGETYCALSSRSVFIGGDPPKRFLCVGLNRFIIEIKANPSENHSGSSFLRYHTSSKDVWLISQCI